MQVLVEGLVPCCARACAPDRCCVEERCVLDTVVSRVIETDEYPLDVELRMVEFEIRQKGFDPNCITTRYREIGRACGGAAAAAPCGGPFARLKQFEEFNWIYAATVFRDFNFDLVLPSEFDFLTDPGDAFNFVEDPPAPTHWETFPGLWTSDLQEVTYFASPPCAIWNAVLATPVEKVPYVLRASKMADMTASGVYGRRRQVLTQSRTFPYNGGFRFSLSVSDHDGSLECTGSYTFRNATTGLVFASGALPAGAGTYDFGPFPAQTGELEVTLLADDACPVLMWAGGEIHVDAILEIFVP